MPMSLCLFKVPICPGRAVPNGDLLVLMTQHGAVISDPTADLVHCARDAACIADFYDRTCF